MYRYVGIVIIKFRQNCINFFHYQKITPKRESVNYKIVLNSL